MKGCKSSLVWKLIRKYWW